MERKRIAIPELAIIAGTRAMFGAGLGLLLAGVLKESDRRAVGWTLLGVGAITTIPILAQLLGSSDEREHEPLFAGSSRYEFAK